MCIVHLFALNRYEVLENIRVVQLYLHKACLLHLGWVYNAKSTSLGDLGDLGGLGLRSR